MLLIDDGFFWWKTRLLIIRKSCRVKRKNVSYQVKIYIFPAKGRTEQKQIHKTTNIFFKKSLFVDFDDIYKIKLT